MFNIALFIIIVSTIILLLWRRFTFWSRQGVKGYKFVEIISLFREQHKAFIEYHNKYGKIYGGFGLTDKFLVVNDPDLIRDMFVKNFDAFPHHKLLNLGPDPRVNKMLFFMPGDENWKRVRSTITPAFTSGKLKAMMSHISDISDKFTSNLGKYEQKGETVDIRKHVGAFAMDVICACAYGINIDSINNPDHPVVENAKKILGVNANFSMILSILAPEIANFLKLSFFDRNATEYFGELTNKIVAERKKLNKYSKEEFSYYESQTEPEFINTSLNFVERRTDFIQLMMDSEKCDKDMGYDSENNELSQNDEKPNKSTGTLTPDELTGNSILFFIAGYDTTSAAISHLVYFLAQDKECQQRLYEELKGVDEFTYDNLSQLKYLNAVIDETLRLAPSLTAIERTAERDFVLSGIKIPKGTTIDIFPFAIHRDPDYWPEPNEFKPERFLNPVHHQWAYLPFGGGPRLCVGQRFALNEMRMVSAKLFKKFEFSIAPGSEHLEYFKGSILFSPKNVMVNLKARN